MAKLIQPCRGEVLGRAILQALGLTELLPVRRIILDCSVDSLVMVYIEGFASEKILELDWAKGLEAAEIKIVDKEGKA